MRRSPVLVLALMACTHPDIPSFGEDIRLPPIDPPTPVVLHTAGAAQWTPDGGSIFYSYPSADETASPVPARLTRTCFGLVPSLGGTRSWSTCNELGTYADSIVILSTPTLNGAGQYLFCEGVFGQPAGGPPASLGLWMSDTANPLGARRLLHRGQGLIGGKVISWIDNLAWAGPTSFIGLAAQFTGSGGTTVYTEPYFLVKGTLTGTGATLQRIAGTEGAISWAFAPNGDIVFLRGGWHYLYYPDALPIYALRNDSTVWRVAPDGGTPTLVGVAPRRLAEISCAGNDCLAADRDPPCRYSPLPNADCKYQDDGSIECFFRCLPLTTRIYHLDLATGAFSLVRNGDTREQIRLSPDGTKYLYTWQGITAWAQFTRT